MNHSTQASFTTPSNPTPYHLSPSGETIQQSSRPALPPSSYDDSFPPLNHNLQTQPSLDFLHSSLESRRREHQAQRNIMEIHRESLRAAERTISLLREQIRLHDERSRRSVSSLVPSPAPVSRPTRTSTQRAALQRSLSSRIATLQDDLRRQRILQQVTADSIDLMRRPEVEGLLEAENSLSDSARSSSLRLSEEQEYNLNGCPIPTYSIVTSAHTSHLVRESSDRWIGTRQRENILTSSSASRRQFFNQGGHHWRPKSDSTSNQDALEREWERQLADGEVDTNGVPILKDGPTIHPSHLLQPTRNQNRSRFNSIHLGIRKVDGLGLQLATASSNSECDNGLSTSTTLSFHPLCLR